MKTVDDIGLPVLAHVRAQMQIDEAWALVKPRAFTWWGHRLAQRVWADPAQKRIGLGIFPIAAETDLLVNTPNEPKTAEAVAVLNSTAALNALVWRPKEGRLSLRCSASIHSEIQGWMTKMFCSAVAMQIAEAEGRADTLQKMIGGRVHTSAHPVNGYRPDPDDMLNVLSVFTTPEDATSPFAGDEMTGLLAALEDKAVATGDESGITVEFPFPGAGPPTVLVRVLADVPNPTYGPGALLLMKLPSLPSDIPSGAILANILNQGEIGEIEAGYGFGAWCLDEEDRKSTAYVAFLPASIYMPGLLESIVVSLAAKAQWVHQFLGLEE